METNVKSLQMFILMIDRATRDKDCSPGPTRNWFWAVVSSDFIISTSARRGSTADVRAAAAAAMASCLRLACSLTSLQSNETMVRAPAAAAWLAFVHLANLQLAFRDPSQKGCLDQVTMSVSGDEHGQLKSISA